MKRALLGLRYSGKECRCVELCHDHKSSLTQSVFVVASGGRKLFFLAVGGTRNVFLLKLST